MDTAQIIVPTGIAASALFVIALVSGMPRFRSLWLHAIAGYACGLVVVIHTAAALACHIFEPLGMLASIGMLLTIASGRFYRKRTHYVLAVVTLVLTVLHVVLIAWLQ